MQIISGTDLAKKIRDDVKNEIAHLKCAITLAIILIGQDEASKIYIKHKAARAAEVGILTEVHTLAENASQVEVLELIKKLNSRNEITGFFIQSPVPQHLSLTDLVAEINEHKDVDGMSPVNLGKLFQGKDALTAATPLAVMEIVKAIPGLSLEAKDVVIINRSPIVGKPLAALMLQANATVQICHSKTANIFEKAKQAYIIVLATGKKDFLTSADIKSGAIIVDCGAPYAEADKSVYKIDGYISPVPGGVGPLTIACLLSNCLKAYKLQNN